MECLLGIRFKDYVILAADMTQMNSIVLMKNTVNKLLRLSSHSVMAMTGHSGDTAQLAKYVQSNLKLYKMKNGYDLSVASSAHLTSRITAGALRSPTPMNVDMVLAGFDPETGPQLYRIDCLGTLSSLPAVTIGHGGYFTIGIMDLFCDMKNTVDDGYEIIKTCIGEIMKRFIINLRAFRVSVVDKDGVKDLPDVTVESLNLEEHQTLSATECALN
uniref:Proteasome subunit beta n=1 Tax=Timema douglasi TaxID=61478 RepID=A0A7R8VYE2_TIMDO|nr:unnamed protein product [Timema douglasi]